MSDNKKYYYLKLKEDFFTSETITLLESMKDGVLYDIIFRTGHKNTVQASLSGSLNKSRYYVSTYVSDAKGICAEIGRASCRERV